MTFNTRKTYTEKPVRLAIRLWGAADQCTMSQVPTLTKNFLATLDGEIVDPEITNKIKMRHVLKVYDVQT